MFFINFLLSLLVPKTDGSLVENMSKSMKIFVVSGVSRNRSKLGRSGSATLHLPNGRLGRIMDRDLFNKAISVASKKRQINSVTTVSLNHMISTTPAE